MSLRQKFEGVGCKRFGDDAEANPANAPSGASSGKKSVDAQDKINTEVASVIADLRKENKALRQQVASQAIEIAALRGTKKPDNKNSGQRQQKPASSKGGRPKLPDDERQARRKATMAAANRKRRTKEK